MPTDMTIVMSKKWMHTPYHLSGRGRSFSIEREAGRQNLHLKFF